MPASDMRDEDHRGHVPTLGAGLGGATAAAAVVAVVAAAAAAAVVGASYNAADRDAVGVEVRQHTWAETHVHSP